MEALREQSIPLEIVEELAFEAMHRVVCAKHAERASTLKEHLRSLISDDQTWKAYLEVETQEGDEQAEGVKYVIQFLHGALRSLAWFSEKVGDDLAGLEGSEMAACILADDRLFEEFLQGAMEVPA